ncbi:hypothetical protein [Metabacillus sediminilitoris]|nr:hypothetical protein [Metabacillus sediminilitoris]
MWNKDGIIQGVGIKVKGLRVMAQGFGHVGGYLAKYFFYPVYKQY